jgi:hypothetical protein
MIIAYHNSQNFEDYQINTSLFARDIKRMVYIGKLPSALGSQYRARI